jgi:hypothetical protein
VVSGSLPDRTWRLCSTASIRPLKRATMPLVRGDWRGVGRCSMPGWAQSRPTACWPVAARRRRPNRRSVNALP